MTGRSWPVSPAAVALDLVDPDEAAVAAQLLAGDPRFRAEVERLRRTGQALGGLSGDQWALAPAPPLRSHPAETPQVGPPPAPVAPLRRAGAGRRLLAVAAAAAVVVAALVVARVALDDGGGGVPAPPPTTLALRPLPGNAGRAELKLNGARTRAELLGAGLRPSGPHDFYEAWLADDRGRMVSMGTFRVGPSGHVDVHMDVAVDVSAYTLVDVSREPDDGNPAHSDTSVLRARL